MTTATQCPCGSQQDYLNCCGLYIEKGLTAPTAEALMRSRYSAFTQANADYIAKTMQGAALEEFDADNMRQWAKQVTWLGLQIIATPPGENKDEGYVEFIATFSENGNTQEIHEMSYFQCRDNNWYYITSANDEENYGAHHHQDGECCDHDHHHDHHHHHRQEPVRSVSIGRNEPCPCGSGKKYKKCCYLN